MNYPYSPNKTKYRVEEPKDDFKTVEELKNDF